MRDRSQYDAAAPAFNRRRALPESVPSAIRTAVIAAVAPLTQPRLLDLGAGAGRIGRAFVEAGDDYVGLDLSHAMLRAFRPAASLVLADGAHLPFADEAFDAVLMVQVLNSTQDWRPVVAEARRVLTSGGVLISGRTKAPDDGIDSHLKQVLADILRDMGHDPYRSAAHEDALDWLTALTGTGDTQIVARWPAERTPRQFIERHGSGARFSGLPGDIRHAAMDALRQRIEVDMGSLDCVASEVHQFELRIFRFHPGASR